MKKISPLDYAYSVGRIRALERFLIKSEVFQEAIDSSLNEALRLFAESNLYSDELLHIQDSRQLEGVLNQETLKLKKLIRDLLLDKTLMGLIELNTPERAQDILQHYSSAFLEDYFMQIIDMHNIKTFLRLYLLKEPKEKLQMNLTGQGFIKREFFLRLYDKDLAAFLHQLEYVHQHDMMVNYAFYLTEAIQKLERENSFVYLEKAINDFLIQILKPAKYLSFGPEPVLAYYFAKANEINLMRLIILAKLNGLPAGLVKERLNNVYA